MPGIRFHAEKTEEQRKQRKSPAFSAPPRPLRETPYHPNVLYDVNLFKMIFAEKITNADTCNNF